MPATRPDVLPPIDVGAWLRAGSKFQGATDPSKVNDWHMDQALIELHAGSKVTKQIAVTLNLTSNMQSLFNPPGNGMGEGGSYVAIEDAIIQFDFMDEFHLWGGHLLVPRRPLERLGALFHDPLELSRLLHAAGQRLRRRGAARRAVGPQQRRRDLG